MRRLAPAFAAALLAGCAAAPPAASPGASPAAPPAVPRFEAAGLPSTELGDVPFFPQTRYQCGPAALATILAYEGLDVDARSLAPEVYVRGLKGSLQAELLGATRRHGLVPYVIEPAPEALFAELASGKPVLVLQNLGLRRLPVWHYAVVVGFDAARRRVLLRSGRRRRRAERLPRFLDSWRLGGRWGIVALDPGELPSAATPESYIRALAGAEPLLGARSDAAYEQAVDRWPREPLVLFAAADHALGQRRYARAVDLYERLLDIEPGHAAARNNLANALAAQGCSRQALAEARAALADAQPESPLRPAIEDTVRQLESSARGRAAVPAACEDPRPAPQGGSGVSTGAASGRYE